MPPAEFDTALALRIIGYNTANLGNAINAFKIHFTKGNNEKILDETDKMILFNLYKKYL